MGDSLKQRLFDLGYGIGSKTPSEAITYIEELELKLYEMNELYGLVKDGLEEKLDKVVEALRFIVEATTLPEANICITRALTDARIVLAELDVK